MDVLIVASVLHALGAEKKEYVNLVSALLGAVADFPTTVQGAIASGLDSASRELGLSVSEVLVSLELELCEETEDEITLNLQTSLAPANSKRQ